MWVSEIYLFIKSSEKQNVGCRKKAFCQNHDVKSWHFTMRKPRPREVNDLAKAAERVSDKPGRECWLYLWSVSQFRSHGAFCMPGFCDDPWGKDFSWHGLFMVWDGWSGGRCKGTFWYSCSPLRSTPTPEDRTASISISRRSLRRYEINTAWQLCSRVMTCSPPCHFQLDFYRSGLHVI